jgi:hypothetical protein
MRASPAFQVTVMRFGAWRGAVLALLAAAAASLVAWLLSAHASTPIVMLAVIGVTGSGLLAAAAGLLRCRPSSLRWDTCQWHLGPASTAGDEPATGRLAVAIDLGGWMLLRFEHELTKPGRRSTWLPVQRRGLETRWHALRCAVYCARPVEGHAAGPHAAISPESQE